MKRLPLLLAALLLAGCTASDPAPTPTPTPQGATAGAIAEPTDAPSPSPSPTGSPAQLPTIPPKLPNEIIRSTFDADAVGNEVATHAFSGVPIAYHILCASHEGAVTVSLMVDGRQHSASTNTCAEPHFIVEDETFPAGSHRVTFQVEPSGGASGVVYLVEGDI